MLWLSQRTLFVALFVYITELSSEQGYFAESTHQDTCYNKPENSGFPKNSDGNGAQGIGEGVPPVYVHRNSRSKEGYFEADVHNESPFRTVESYGEPVSQWIIITWITGNLEAAKQSRQDGNVRDG